MVLEGEALSAIIYQFDESDFTITQFEGLRMDGSEVIDVEDGQITHGSIMEDPLMMQYNASSCSNDASSNSAISMETDIFKKKKKKKGSDFLPGIVLSLSGRRKGAPQRAPLS